MIVFYLTAIASLSCATVAQIQERRRAHHEVGPGAGPVAGPFLLASALILVGVAALRWNVGVDYAQYERHYRTYAELKWSELSVLREPGIRVLAILGSRVRDDPAIMFAFAAIITVGLTIWTLHRHSEYFPLALSLYLVTGAWQGSFNGVRQYLACAILFAGHRFIIDREFRKYLGVVLLAALFHISAIAMLLLYAVPRRRLGLFPTVIMIALASAAASYYDAAGDIISWLKQDEVTDGAYFSEELNPLRIAAAFAPCAVYVVFTDKSRLTSAGLFYANVLIINAALTLAASGSAYMARFTIYTGVYIALGLPFLLNMTDRRLRQLIIAAALVLYACFWWTETSSTSALANFRWIFQR